ncbi:LysE family transporter [Ramlibacter sp. G-1-2-2]|uniref:LysE family transporter n=1 Tax=Ramlibacter agri TaxID=2728837 RepID=A0A848HAD9_9BURK|nr:LysE family transporter [Ramlibacter agri]NML47444.1 LysE family transporter [Ramlibacter agri]
MQGTLPLLAILGALGAGVVSPGPSFVMVARVAVFSSRAEGLGAALGMGLGGLLFASAALAGLQAVLLAVPTLYLVLKVCGGLYLCYLGYRIFRGATQALATDAAGGPRASRWRSVVLGFTTQVSNPKTSIIYASVFAAFLPGHVSAAFAAVLLLAVFCMETGWYALVALVLSAGGPRALYLRAKKWLDRLAGTVLAALGLRLVAMAWSE